jgi:hypothetical protein
MSVYIYATSANVWPAEPHAPELKALVKELWGKSYRRISHFIELSLVGAKRCTDRAPIPIDTDCNLIFTTGQGNISQVASLTREIFKEQQPPMPFAFMHITNNMAPFYVAQALGLTSSNLTVAHRAFPFETAIDLAGLQMKTPRSQCLVGAVDECAYPLHDHRKRLDLAPDTPLGEGSHWLLLGTDPQHAIAQIEFCYFYHSQQALFSELANHKWHQAVTLSCGFGIDDNEQQWWQQQLNIEQVYDYRPQAAYHDTAAAYGIASYIETHSKQSLIHINKSSQQRYCAVCVTVL